MMKIKRKIYLIFACIVFLEGCTYKSDEEKSFDNQEQSSEQYMEEIGSGRSDTADNLKETIPIYGTYMDDRMILLNGKCYLVRKKDDYVLSDNDFFDFIYQQYIHENNFIKYKQYGNQIVFYSEETSLIILYHVDSGEIKRYELNLKDNITEVVMDENVIYISYKNKSLENNIEYGIKIIDINSNEVNEVFLGDYDSIIGIIENPSEGIFILGTSGDEFAVCHIKNNKERKDIYHWRQNGWVSIIGSSQQGVYIYLEHTDEMLEECFLVTQNGELEQLCVSENEAVINPTYITEEKAVLLDSKDIKIYDEKFNYLGKTEYGNLSWDEKIIGSTRIGEQIFVFCESEKNRTVRVIQLSF